MHSFQESKFDFHASDASTVGSAYVERKYARIAASSGLPASLKDLLLQIPEPEPSIPNRSQFSLPEDDERSHDAFPYSNLTQAALHWWNALFHPSERATNQLFLILKHPGFRVEDVPANAAQLHQLDKILPLCDIGAQRLA